MSKKVAFHTLGCKLNFSESSYLLSEFERRGYTQANDNEPADVVFINTCTVTQSADSKSRKAIRKAVKNSKNAFVVVTGCYAQSDADAIAEIEGVNLVLGTGEKFNFFKHFDRHSENKKVYSCDINSVRNFDTAWSGSDRTRSFLKVQDGCDYVCSYCIIPKVRGKSRNKPISEVLEDAKKIAETGKQEIILTGVNIGDFGKSSAESFFELLNALNRQAAVPRIRLSSVEPNLLHDKIIDLVAESDIFMPHFHIPLQSGSGELLKLMKRPYTPDLFVKRIEYIRRVLPHAFIGLDVIVGFPGETDALFNETYNFLKSLKLSFLHVFSYSDRKGTPASQSSQKVLPSVIKERSMILHDLSEQKHQEFYSEQIGKTGRVLFEETDRHGAVTGFSDNYVKVKLQSAFRIKNTIQTVQYNNVTADGFISVSLI